MPKTIKKPEVYNFQKANRRIIMYYYNKAGDLSAMNTSQDKFEAWLKDNNLTSTVLSCDGEDTEVPMNMDEYWQCLPKATHLQDLSDFLTDLKAKVWQQ